MSEPAPVIVFTLFPGVTQLDFTGPHEVFSSLSGASVIMASTVGGTIEATGGMTFTGVRRLAEIAKCDVLCVPGGRGSIDSAIHDEVFLTELRRLAATARYITSVCTGSLVLGADHGAGVPYHIPVQALRLPLEVIDGLRRLGFDRIGDLMSAPRAPLVKRFGTVLALRLAQALGDQFESIHPLTPPDVIERRLMFVEPLSTAEAFEAVLDKLMRNICRRLERAALGARRLDLVFERVDNSVQTIRIGTAQPSRDAIHLTRLLRERFEQVNPGAGVEAMRLIATTAEPLEFAQIDAMPLRERTNTQELAGLMDRLINRFGVENVYRITPIESDVPERSVQRAPALVQTSGMSWPITLPRPARLLTPPQPVMAIAPLPDHPPAAFTWRKHRHRIRRADGPERIAGEWWKREGEVRAVRDYFAVEDEDGRRFWLFRRGDGQDTASGDLQWFLHGLF